MWIKICANTCLEDALRAAELGADAVGFVFAPSARQVTPEQVRVIADRLPPGLERIGVFGVQSAGEIAEAAETARLTGIQMHGGFDEGVAARLGELLPGLVRIPVVHWEVNEREDTALKAAVALDQIAKAGPGSRVLVDARMGRASGGLGVAFDWESAQGVFADEEKRGTRMILAGGLRPDNVREAIRVLRPWGVDVASGVEREPGRKDFGRLAEFIGNVRRA